MIFIIAFLAGILSFFSPCILPILPIYIGYLGTNDFKNKKNIIVNTIFFSIGISFAFFSLAFAFSTFGNFFNNYKDIIVKIGSLFIIFLGLFQLNIFKFNFLEKERKIPFKIKKMNPLIAFIFGFTFSFSWTPCIGPALSSILITISTLESFNNGALLISAYTAGFIIPFLITGLFSSYILGLIRKNNKLFKYTNKIIGIFIILIGLFSLLNSNNFQIENYSKIIKTESKNNIASNADKNLPLNFNLKNQYGNFESLSLYKDKVIFLNFWATWCPPCRDEMPYIEELYKEYGENKKDVVFIGVNNEDHLKMTNFLNENNYSFPTITDTEEQVFNNYNIAAFPTTFIIGRDGNIEDVIVGGTSKATMKEHIEKELDK